MRLISWNVNGRVASLWEQSQALFQRHPDVVALQEVLPTTARRWQEQLAQRGLLHSVHSFALQSNPLEQIRRRQYGELLASRWPLAPLPPTLFPVPWPERVLSAVLDSPCGAIELHTTSIPPGVSNGWLKVEMFEGIYARFACPAQCARILCGDLNTPQAVSADGRMTTWGQVITANGSVRTWRTKRDACGRIDTGDRWDAAERSVLAGLAQFDLPDVFRALHGYGVQEWSWYWQGNGRRIGRRFDHVFASQRLHAVQCQYLHAYRERGLSDHSPIEVDFAPGHAELQRATT
jgi:exonuclease III